jgi:sarcosine oxidase
MNAPPPGTGSTERCGVLVVGVGAVGACTCRALAQRGADVIGLDRFSIPNVEASYHGESRVFRTAYYEHPDYVPLLQRARQLWLAMGCESSEPLYLETRGLYMGRATSPFVCGSLKSLEAHGLEYERLDRAALRERFAQWCLPDDFVGVLEPHAGVLYSQNIVAAAAHGARRAGAILREAEAVLDWRADSSGVDVRTDCCTYRADRLVLCAGAWSKPMLGDIGRCLTVTRQVMAWFQPDDAARFSPGCFPIWGLDCGDEPFHYGFPVLPEFPGLKLAHHAPGPATTPHDIDRQPHASEIESIRAAARTYLPGADGRLLRASVCMYTNSPDGHFIVDTHPDSDRVLMCAGLSGHGFKFASVLGEALADLATDGTTDLPVGFLSSRRFL